MNKGTLFVISGPSGVGKGTLVLHVLERLKTIALSVSATTRPPRPDETDGISYHFLSKEQFEEIIEQGGFLEWAVVYDNRYGTLKEEVERHLNAGQDLILEIDVQGGLQVMQRYPDAVLIFIEPPSLEILEKRLRARETESEESIRKRLEIARLELACKERYTIVITNDDLETAVTQLIDFINSYRM